MNKLKITVVGAGYVGMSIAAVLAQHNDVILLDIDSIRTDKINNKLSTVVDKDLDEFLIKKQLSLSATLDKKVAYKDASFVVIATPSNYDSNTNFFDTSIVDGVVGDAIELNSNAHVIIKSTIPIGHTNSLQEKHNTTRISFSPEFLREGASLMDNLYPSRIVMGANSISGTSFIDLMTQGAYKEDIEILNVSPSEAEAIKLFSNAYLAMRVSFFNELDSYAMLKNLDSKNIINGVCLDKRIGDVYNNPSFGYGGYCLPKDTKQLLASYDLVPQSLIQAIVSSNRVRKDFIADEIIKLNPQKVGFYRIVMKKDSDNYRSSSVLRIIERIKSKGIGIAIYEPNLKNNEYFDYEVVTNLDEFKDKCCVIVANRLDKCLNDVSSKCFSRDIFGDN